MVNVAVIGLGWWGKTLVGLMQQSATLRVVALADPSPSARSFADTTGIRLVPALADVLDDPNVDAVVLCTPHSLHCEQIIAAAAAGKHVFGEKPFCQTEDQARRAVAAACTAGIVLGIGHEKRFEPPIATAVAMARRGDLGRVLQIEANFNQDKFLGLAPDNWRISAKESPVGPLTATGIHLVDLAVSVLGPVANAYARNAQLDSRLANGDTLAIMLAFQGGGHALITSILATPFSGRFAIYGSKGWVEVRDKSHPELSEGWVLTTSLRGAPVEVVDVPADPSALRNLEAFAAAIEGRADYPVSASEMVDTVAAMEAIVRSCHSGQPEALSTNA